MVRRPHCGYGNGSCRAQCSSINRDGIVSMQVFGTHHALKALRLAPATGRCAVSGGGVFAEHQVLPAGQASARYVCTAVPRGPFARNDQPASRTHVWCLQADL
jgi:hypothetical protein